MLILMGCLLYGCSKSEVDPKNTNQQSEYVLMAYNTADYIDHGTISKYSYSSDALESDLYQIAPTPHGERFADAVIHNDHLYLVRQKTGVIDKVRLSDNTLAARWQASQDLSKPENTSYDKTIGIINNQVVVAYRKALEPGESDTHVFATYLKFFSPDNLQQTDSVFLAYDYNILDFISVKNKVFISLKRPNAYTENLLLVLDALNNQQLTSLSLTKPVSQLIITGSEQLLALNMGGLQQINPDNYAITDFELQAQGSNTDSSTPTIALDQENNLLYYYLMTAQPAPTPFILASYNLDTYEITRLTDYDIAINTDSPIVFDSKQGVIVIGASQQDSDGMKQKLLVLDKSGQVIKESITPFTVQKILIR